MGFGAHGSSSRPGAGAAAPPSSVPIRRTHRSASSSEAVSTTIAAGHGSAVSASARATSTDASEASRSRRARSSTLASRTPAGASQRSSTSALDVSCASAAASDRCRAVAQRCVEDHGDAVGRAGGEHVEELRVRRVGRGRRVAALTERAGQPVGVPDAREILADLVGTEHDPTGACRDPRGERRLARPRVPADEHEPHSRPSEVPVGDVQQRARPPRHRRGRRGGRRPSPGCALGTRCSDARGCAGCVSPDSSR